MDSIFLKQSKNDRSHQDTHIITLKTNTNICPFSSLMKLLCHRSSAPQSAPCRSLMVAKPLQDPGSLRSCMSSAWAAACHLNAIPNSLWESVPVQPQVSICRPQHWNPLASRERNPICAQAREFLHLMLLHLNLLLQEIFLSELSDWLKLFHPWLLLNYKNIALSQ